MKKILLAFVFILSIVLVSHAQGYDVRKVKWGMNHQEVKSSETIKPVIDVEGIGLSYGTRVLNKSVKLMYLFFDKKLSIVAYNFDEKYDTENQYILDFKEIKKELIEKYGTPKNDEEIWIDNMYKDNPNYYGYAVSKGALKYKASWLNAGTLITLSLEKTKGKKDINLSLTYSDYEAIKARQKDKNGDL